MPPLRLDAESRRPKTLRQRAINQVEENIIEETALFYACVPRPTILPPKLKNAILVHNYLTTTRYIYPNPTVIQPSSAVYRDEPLSDLCPLEFKRALRVTEPFNFIIERIQHHPVFLSEGTNPQQEVVIQLKVALHRLGHDGSLSSYRAISVALDISVSSVSRYTQRCIVALNALTSKFIKWPDQREEREIKKEFMDRYHFRDAIGAIDVTMIDLWKAPEYDRDSWSTRKHSFSMEATAVCDGKGVFTFFSTAYLGRTHDSSAFKNSDLCRYENEYFSGRDSLLADAAYALSTSIIPRYKGSVLTVQQKRFDIQHARDRAKIEHAFGMLKGEFLSLTRMRCDILDDKNIQEAAAFIIAYVVLQI